MIEVALLQDLNFSWSSTFIKYKIADSHKLYLVTIFIIILTKKLDRLQETEKYQRKTSYKENFKK